MKKKMTLRELCEATGVSRRAVQGYEIAELVGASDRNKYGHLLYDQEAERRIKEIKLFQEAGFTVKQIKVLIEAPNDILKEALQEQIAKLMQEIEQKENVICEVKKMIDRLQDVYLLAMDTTYCQQVNCKKIMNEKGEMKNEKTFYTQYDIGYIDDVGCL